MSRAVSVLKHFETPSESGTYYRLVCLTGKNKGRAYYLIGKRIVLGRSDKVDIQILDIKSSREHAEIILAAGNFVLTDLGSQNGIIVNDLKIKQHSLSDGDKVVVGQTVYKFSKVVVQNKDNPKVENVKLNLKENEQLEDELSEAPKNKKLTPMLTIVIVVAVLILLFSGDEKKESAKVTSEKPLNYNLKEVSDPFAAALKQKKKESQKNKEKLSLYFQRGLREYREGNYFRAISEFEHARQWSPEDPLAKFYLRKTKEELHKKIDEFFSKAIRSSDGLNYQGAITSYCAVVRLLNSYPNDKRYKDAIEGIKNLEKKMGLDEGEIECSQKADS